MLTTQYLDNWAYQANVRDYVTRMDQKLEAHAITPVYASRNQELQSLAKEQLQRYASTYLGVDPRTIDVTLLGSACLKSTSRQKDAVRIA